MNLYENYRHLKTEAFAGGTQKHEGAKRWTTMLEAVPLYLGSKERGRLLLAVYTSMRLLDDMADGDRPPPAGFSRVVYLEDKQAFVQNPQNPHDELDYLFTYCYQLADNIGIDIHEELDAFFTYFLFDAKRLGTGKAFTCEELDHAYDACDIKGTIRGALMVFGDDPDKATQLYPLGKAARKYYTLRDYEDDIAAGFVNIPAEAMLAHGIMQDDLPNRYSPPVRAWFQEEASRGLLLLDEHRAVMKNGSFRWNGKLVLPIAYERTARAYFQAVLSGRK